ncbi:MAG: hypothetical protein FWC93_05050 [Defluviitaleaceae bacterium]|nr:hypothetical protein [Defluviitaleaceae bacterium]
MDFKLYDDVKAFHADVFDVLMENEAQNLIILGNVIMGAEGRDTFGWRNPANWVMATAANDGRISLVGLMTPPFNLTLYAVGNTVDDAAVQRLMNGLIEANIPVPGVTTEKSLAEAFTAAYCTAKGLDHKIHMSQRIYELTAVNPEIPQIGHFRPARENDMAFLPFWANDFYRLGDSYSHVDENTEMHSYLIDSGTLYILEDNGMAVSMARITREMISVAGVGYVYTPPYFRGQGYAGSVVAQISQLCLDRGFARCVLYTA